VLDEPHHVHAVERFIGPGHRRGITDAQVRPGGTERGQVVPSDGHLPLLDVNPGE
jgi:hypothetical protein